MNTERYPWEGERLTPTILTNAEYSLPIGTPQADAGNTTTVRLKAGRAALPGGGSVALDPAAVWYGDLGGDSYQDPAVALSVKTSVGTSVYAVPLPDVGGKPK